MSNEVEQQAVEPEANPYNAKKSWHTPDAPSQGSADGLFFEKPKKQATPEKAPETKETSDDSKYKKRYDDLKRHYDQKVNTFKQERQELEAQLASYQPTYTPPKTPEELEAFKEQNPDLFDVVETVSHQRSEEKFEELQKKLATYEEREKAATRQENLETLKAKHPDVDDIVGSDTFKEWADEQPKEVYRWVYENPDNVQLAIKALDLYKLEKGISTTNAQKRKPSKSQNPDSKAADLVSTRTTQINTKEPKVWSQREISKLSMAEYDKYESEIDQAVMEGRIVP